MRPKTVAAAELIYLASLALVVALSAMTWDATVEQLGAGASAAMVIGVVAVSLAALLPTTRLGSRVALVILTLITLITLAGLAIQLSSESLPDGTVGTLTLAQAALVTIANALLFGGTARAWYAARRARPAA